MVQINMATKEITMKVVYYGPALSGKTTNLQQLHAMMDPASRGQMVTLDTKDDRTLYFDFLPVEFEVERRTEDSSTQGARDARVGGHGGVAR